MKKPMLIAALVAVAAAALADGTISASVSQAKAKLGTLPANKDVVTNATASVTLKDLTIGSGYKVYNGTAAASVTAADLGALTTSDAASTYFPLSGGTLSGSLTVGGGILNVNCGSSSSQGIKLTTTPSQYLFFNPTSLDLSGTTTSWEKIVAAANGIWQPLLPYATNAIPYAAISGSPTSLKNPYALTFGSKTYDGSGAQTITAADLGVVTTNDAASTYVPLTRKVNNKPLSTDITLTASDVSALPSSTTHLSGDVPTSRTINGKSLGANVTLTGADIAVSTTDSTKINAAISNLSSGKVNVSDLQINGLTLVNTNAGTLNDVIAQLNLIITALNGLQ